MKLTKEQIETIENTFECDISEVSNFTIATFILQDSDVFPDFEHNIGKYFGQDDIGISYTEIQPTKEDTAPNDYTIKANSKEKAITMYKEYIETQFKIMQAIMDINGAFYNAVEDDFYLRAEADVVGFDTSFDYIISKVDNKIRIYPITYINVDF